MVPLANVGFAGVIAMDTKVAGVTVRVCVAAVTPPSFTEMVAVPAPVAVANPVEETVSTLLFDPR